jgi:murein DD-endopeptidase MepM/ murein hydrolase activator NlpD
MRSPRYTILIANRETGTVRRLTVSRRPALAAIAMILAIPVLMGLGARWSAQSEIQALQVNTEALRIENDSYRTATGELASQITSLQSTMVDLGQQAQLDPAARQAMENLPAFVKSRAMGGAPAVDPMLSKQTSTGAPAGTIGILHNLLGVLGARLESVKSGVERQQALAAATPSIWPIARDASWFLTSMFGNRSDPFTGLPEYHPGLDIATDYGTPVHATADGTIESAGYSGNYGIAVVIKHDFGIGTRYGHLSRLNVGVGQAVRRGDVVGYVGQTGRATATHLHYEILLNGQAINPLRLLTNK